MLELFHRRYACKAYDPTRKVSDADFAAIMEAGRLAPSSMGLEPWEFVHLTDPKLIAAIQTHAWGGVDKIGVASHLVLLLGRVAADLKPGSDYVRYLASEIQGGGPEQLAARAKRMTTFQAEDQDLTSDRLVEEWINRQVYLALGNMMTAAALLDIDSTPIEGFHVAKVAKLLEDAGVYDPKHLRLVVMATFGYAAGEPRPKLRRPATEVWRTWPETG